ncbi:MAG: rhodanese-like domain-containing protein [Cyclobacteriaceae bacterium]|nr:rhodanese-like domain-containing protein [Cyclobacteriaceae bacterium]
MGLLSIFGIKSKSTLLKEALTDGAIVVDVRTPQEYNEGHISGSLNIPVNQIEARASMLKKKEKTIILCCKSGGRAGQAKSILEKNGISCINGGSWGSLNYLMH